MDKSIKTTWEISMEYSRTFIFLDIYVGMSYIFGLFWGVYTQNMFSFLFNSLGDLILWLDWEESADLQKP